ncbi:MAG: hypothetical protein IKV26_02495 [Paludibacteraceae bacterium]|nr:hypothetical protein [Paludibacteraceae bacterium]
MPTIPNIRTSIENQQTLILDPHARAGQFLRDKRDRLIAYTGGFTVVYPYIVNNEKWALRCWHADLGNVRKRFNVISKAIQHSKANYLCDFVYVDEGIVVDGKVYPTTRMRWVEGMTIKNYICKHKNSKNKLQQLAENFLLMVQDMHRNKFAHGDLQHGNIVVNDKGELFLVDYDSFYCPDLKGEREIITGLKDYQHPLRQSNLIISEKIDYFSELIIYLSILAIANNPAFVDKYQVTDSEHLLFEAKDFQDIKKSSIYNDILILGNEFPILLQILEVYLSKTSLSDLQPFDVLLEQLTKDPIINKFSASCGEKILNGKYTTISWDIDNFTQIFLNDKDVTNLTSKKLKINSTSTYTLKVINGRKQISRSLTLSAFPSPTISITASKTKLHKGRNESVTLNWNVQDAMKIILLQNDSEINKECSFNGSFNTIVKETTTFTIKIIALDEKTEFTKSVIVEVFPDAKFTFKTDKEYVLPTVPFTLSWSTIHAKTVELNGIKIKDSGIKVISSGIDKDTTYTLSVTDEFGVKEKSIEVKMLPLPIIKSLVVPMPNIEKNITLNVNLNVPTFSVDSLNDDLQKIDLNESKSRVIGIDKPQKVELNLDPSKLSIWSKIRKNITKLFNRN